MVLSGGDLQNGRGYVFSIDHGNRDDKVHVVKYESYRFLHSHGKSMHEDDGDGKEHDELSSAVRCSEPCIILSIDPFDRPVNRRFDYPGDVMAAEKQKLLISITNPYR
jgi:hypothetical protein